MLEYFNRHCQLGAPFFINLYGNLQCLKKDITQIPRIPFFLKLKIVLIPVWELKVSKTRINYTSLCSYTHHVIKSHGSRDYKSYPQPNEGLLFPILIKV